MVSSLNRPSSNTRQCIRRLNRLISNLNHNNSSSLRTISIETSTTSILSNIRTIMQTMFSWVEITALSSLASKGEVTTVKNTKSDILLQPQRASIPTLTVETLEE